jgi:hypothetical protein
MIMKFRMPAFDLERRDDPAYKHVLATGSEFDNIDELNTMNRLSGESFSKLLEVQATMQIDEGTAPLVQHARMRETTAA